MKKIKARKGFYIFKKRLYVRSLFSFCLYEKVTMDEGLILFFANIVWALMGYYYGRSDEKVSSFIGLISLTAVFLVMFTVKLLVK